MNSAEIETALRAKYAPPEYAILFEVRNGTGFARRTERYADAVAMNLYPSRGLEIIGFEIKASRSDWLRELKDPDKAEEIGKFCDRWYVVAGDADIVKPGELPSGWGLILPYGKGLRVSTEAPPRQATPVDKVLLASLLRAAFTQSPNELAIKARIEKEVKERMDAQQRAFDVHLENANKRRTELQNAVDAFHKASGVHISTWDAGNIGEAVRFLVHGGLNSMVSKFEHIGEIAKSIHDLSSQAAEFSRKNIKEADRDPKEAAGQ